MPGEDRTGPLGQGPRTGRGLGRCKDPSDKDQPNTSVPADGSQDLEPQPGRGRGRGRGLGRGPGRGGGRGFGRGFGRR